MTKDETKQIALAERGITLWYEKCEQSYLDKSMTLLDGTEVFTLYCSSNHEVITDNLVKKAIQKDIDNHNDDDIFGRADYTKIFIVLYYEDMGEFFVYQERDSSLW